jgi:hypothetical protein
MKERVKIQRPQIETMIVKGSENNSPVLSPLRVVINRAKKD